MDERDFEARVAARLRDRFDHAEPSDDLRFRVSEAVRAGTPQVRRSRSLWAAAAVAAVIVATVVAIWAIRPAPTAVVGGPSPAPTATAIPSAGSARPYRLTVLSGGSPGPMTSIATAADCDTLPTEWLRSFCALTLRSDWRAIVAPTDPLAQPSDTSTSVTWFASMARASIDGDTSLCSDVAMREWVTLGSGLGGAPPPGSTAAPVHPVAACLDYLRSTAAKGTFTITDPAGQDTVQISVDPGAGARAAGGSAPAFDPKLVCGQGLTRDVCTQLVDAVTTALGSRQSGVQVLSGHAQPVGCSTSVTPCPPPNGGRWLGSVLVGLGGNEVLAFDVADVGGQVTATEVPYKP